MIKPIITVQKMKKYDPPLENRKNKLRLDFNENSIGCSPKVLSALKNIKSEEIAAYPEYNESNKIISNFFKVKKSEILLTNGVDEAIQVVMNSFLKENDEVIIPSPTFAMFQLTASMIGAKNINILYNQDLSFPIEKVLSAINKKTKLIVLVNPNNPTSSDIKQKDIIKILKKAKNAIVLIDEAYYEFYGKTSKNLINKYKNLIVARTFSKAWGLAGLRIGSILSNKEIISTLQKVRSPYSVNALALIALKAAIKDQKFVNKYVKQVNAGKKYLLSELKKLNIKTYPAKANFVIANFGKSCIFIYNQLKENNILVRNRSNYPLLKNCLRLGIGTLDQCKRLITQIKPLISKPVLLFDMDGVLVDVSNSYRLAIKKTAEFFTNQKITNQDIQALKEKGSYNNDWDLTEKIIQDKKINIPKTKIINKFQSLYWGKNGFINNEPFLISQKNLEKLNKQYRLGIVTGRPKIEALYVLKKFKVMKYFETLIAMENYPKNKAKPNPYSINTALKDLNTPKSIIANTVYIGDSVDDMAAAKNARITPLGIIPPNNPSTSLKSLLKKNGAKIVVNTINELMEVLK